MKVGIITFHHTTNYGATLQAYALWEAITDQGYEAEVIDYRPYSAVRHYRQKVWMPEEKDYGKKRLILNLVNNFLPNLKKYVRMRYFLTSKVKLSEKILDQESLSRFFKDNRRYDTVVAGSDQIWCTISIRGFDPSYFLDFIPATSRCRKVSYAASMGPTKTLTAERDVVSQLVKAFDAVAVRDSNSLKILRDECEVRASRVLDPTFLTSFEAIIPRRQQREKPYLLLYLEKSISSEEKLFIQAVANKQGLQIISIGNSYGISNKVLKDIGPKDWLFYFKHSAFIVTNFYHGTIFSIKFNQQFTTLIRESKINKTKDLLDMLGLTQRMVTDIDVNTLENQVVPVDYKLVNERLNQEISKSKSYLFEALSQPKSVSRTEVETKSISSAIGL